jgi:hypothetical protein
MHDPQKYEADLERAIEIVLSSPEDSTGRHAQIKGMIEDGNRQHAGQLCASILQDKALGAKPFEKLPIDSDGRDNGPAARLVRRLWKAGLSNAEPDPLKALGGAIHG